MMFRLLSKNFIDIYTFRGNKTRLLARHSKTRLRNSIQMINFTGNSFPPCLKWVPCQVAATQLRPQCSLKNFLIAKRCAEDEVGCYWSDPFILSFILLRKS